MRVCNVHYIYDHDNNRTGVQLPTYTSSNTNRFYGYTFTPDALVAAQTIPDPSITGGSGRITSHQYTYDGARRVVKDQQVTAQAPATVTAYTADGLVASITPPAAGTVSHFTSYVFDANGEPTSVTNKQDAATSRVSYTDYFSDGKVAAQVDPSGNTTSDVYDGAGNTSAVYSPSANAGGATNPNHIPTSYTYFEDNLLRTTTIPTNTAGTQRRLTSYSYDAAGRKTMVDADHI